MIKKQTSRITLIVALIAVAIVLLFQTKSFAGEGKILGEAASTKSEEVSQIDTSDWKTYRNEEYGFEIKYPATIKEFMEFRNKRFLEDEYRYIFMVKFPYFWEKLPFQSRPFNFSLPLTSFPICGSDFYVGIIEKPLTFSLERIRNSYENSEYVTISGTKGIRINEFVGEAPGGGGKEDMVYLPKGSRVYLIYYSVDKEVLGDERNVKKCLEEQGKIFNQMLSTLKFVK